MEDALEIAGCIYRKSNLRSQETRWELLRRSDLFRRHCWLVRGSALPNPFEVISRAERDFFRDWALPIPPSPVPTAVFLDPDLSFEDLLTRAGCALLKNFSISEVRSTMQNLATLISNGGIQEYPSMPMVWLGGLGLNAVEVDVQIPQSWGNVQLLREAIVSLNPPLYVLKDFLIDRSKNAIRLTLALPGALLPPPVSGDWFAWLSGYEEQLIPVEEGLLRAIRNAYPSPPSQSAVALPPGASRANLKKWLHALDIDKSERGGRDQNHARTRRIAEAAIKQLEATALARMEPETKLLLHLEQLLPSLFN